MPPLVVPVYHAAISSALPCTVILNSSAMVPPVTSAPWKETSLIWIAPISASQNSNSSGFWSLGLTLCVPNSPSLQAVGTEGNKTGSGPMLLKELQGGLSHRASAHHPLEESGSSACQLYVRPTKELWSARHKPGWRRQAPALAHPLVRAISAPPVTGVPSVALWSSVAFRIMLIVKEPKLKGFNINPSSQGLWGHKVIKTTTTQKHLHTRVNVARHSAHCLMPHMLFHSSHMTAASLKSAHGLVKNRCSRVKERRRIFRAEIHPNQKAENGKTEGLRGAET